MSAARARRDVLLQVEATYAATVLCFSPDASDDVVDLRAPLGARELDVFARAGLVGPFAVLSAYPSFGRTCSPLEAERRTHRLRAMIAVHGVPPVPVLARAADGPHREPSLAATLSKRDALALARCFDQDAVYWFDGARFTIEWCDSRPATLLPRSAPGAPDCH